ncbi:MAG: PLDc N-terminal domain-containing protein [Gemmatimonadota bacterium]
MDPRALAPLLILAIALVGYCLFDIYRAPAVRYLPRWGWALICVVSVPLGPLAYLMLGRETR